MTWQIRQREAELLGEKRGIAIGEERGIAIGEKRGIAIGEERGIAIGEKRGEKRGKLETARAMLRELPMDQVARFTGLSREELQALAAAGFDGVGETEKQTEGTNETPEMPTAADTEPQESEEQEPVQLTVSLPLARHTGMSLRNLINLLYTRAPLLNKALGTAFRVDERLVNVLRDDANVLTMERFFETVTNVENAIGKAVDGLIFAADRLTFSTLPETSDTATLRCFATLCAMMNKQAITQQRIQAKEITAENEKYAMRIWLLRLDMNGSEYKEERRILMENLSGHAAFRTEEDKVRWQARQNEKRDALRAAKQMEVTDDADAE